jgi:hypothetical protein
MKDPDNRGRTSRARSASGKAVPVSLLVLTAVFLSGMIIALFGYAQDRAVLLYVGVCMTIVGEFFWVLRISVWGDNS